MGEKYTPPEAFTRLSGSSPVELKKSQTLKEKLLDENERKISDLEKSIKIISEVVISGIRTSSHFDPHRNIFEIYLPDMPNKKENRQKGVHFKFYIGDEYSIPARGDLYRIMASTGHRSAPVYEKIQEYIDHYHGKATEDSQPLEPHGGFYLDSQVYVREESNGRLSGRWYVSEFITDEKGEVSEIKVGTQPQVFDIDVSNPQQPEKSGPIEIRYEEKVVGIDDLKKWQKEARLAEYGEEATKFD